MGADLVQRPASQVDASWIGRQVTVGKFRGGLSDVEQHPDRRRTELWLGGSHLEVGSDAIVTASGAEFLGGAL